MITIVGAGISGLYLGLLCQMNELEFEILEKEVYTGGRIYTDYTSYGAPVELGASIFHSNQKLLLELLDQFEVEYVEVKKGETLYEMDCNKVEYPKKASGKFEDVINDPCNPGMDESAKMNYNTWKNSYDQTGKILICKKGFETLTDKMAEQLKDYIKFNQKVEKVEKDYLIVNGKRKKFDKLVICTSLLEAREFMKVPQSVESIPSLRIYVELKNEIPFDYRYIVSDKMFRWAIIIDKKLLLASYTDGERAEALANLGEKKAIEDVMSELGIEESEVNKTWFMFWKKGFEIVKWDKDVRGQHEVAKNVYTTFIPDIDRNGQDQAWVEAHLRTAKSVFEKLFSE